MEEVTIVAVPSEDCKGCLFEHVNGCYNAALALQNKAGLPDCSDQDPCIYVVKSNG